MKKTQHTNTETQTNAGVNAIDTKLLLAQKIIAQLRDELGNLERLLASQGEASELETFVARHGSTDHELMGPANEGKILEGVFDGETMIGSDGKQYIVPPNYASKSKLVEGDILKLTIQPNGTFLYKQIGPIERQRVVGSLVKDDITNDWCAVALGKKYKLLSAAVSFYKGEVGDDAVVLIPQSAPSKWAALENIIKRS